MSVPKPVSTTTRGENHSLVTILGSSSARIAFLVVKVTCSCGLHIALAVVQVALMWFKFCAGWSLKPALALVSSFELVVVLNLLWPFQVLRW
jgi:hypothetical protein